MPLQILSLCAAIALSGYLSYIKHTHGIPPCTVGGGCTAALYSKWGDIHGVALAYIGLTASTVILLLTPWLNAYVRIASLGLLIAGALYTIYLRYVEQAHFDHKVCMWCVMFMIAWWCAMACELRRFLRPVGDDGDDVPLDEPLPV